MTSLPRCGVNMTDRWWVTRADPFIDAHGDIYQDEIATLVLLAGGLLQGKDHRGPVETFYASGCTLKLN